MCSAQFGSISRYLFSPLATRVRDLTLGFEASFSERSLPIPGTQRTRIVDVSLDVASPGATEEIADALNGAATIRDSRVQDKAYKALAVKAALKADVGLAEDILFKIKENRSGVRRHSSFTARWLESQSMKPTGRKPKSTQPRSSTRSGERWFSIALLGRCPAQVRRNLS